MSYANGEIPLGALIRVPGQEEADAWLSAATCARWLALKRHVYNTWGVIIWIVPGWNAYRPLPNQEYAKAQACAEGRCQDAADPGTSSHGGRYIQEGSPRNGQAALAIDVGGYEALDRGDWYAACRAFGFEPGFFDWEPWHIIDWDPQIGTPGPADPTPNPTSPEEDEMTATYINVLGAAGKRRGGTYAIMRSNPPQSQLFARFVSESMTPGVPTIDTDRAQAEWDGTLPGLA
ncbi:hypothetical protein J2Y69_003352 [Microbacterium resistens]|uniref:Peptidase M15B domain-containing protein n=1 Tax=Microbacterium resistens TaxID=156977 RepID=A0ABU1SHE9_9MICO|nr:hypothetical protein [Microbacterium resistens]MDR6868728.1 hypothetical protein [Microbacterium resistens]